MSYERPLTAIPAGKDTEVIFNVQPYRRKRGQMPTPLGIVVGIEVPGVGRSKAGWFSRRLAVVLPHTMAVNTLAFYQQHIAGPDKRYNCLAYMAVAQDWPVDVAEMFFDSGPRLIEGRYQEVADLTTLAPGEPYGLPDDDNQLVHGIVGVGLHDVHIEVDRDGGELRIVQTTATVPAYLGNCALPNRLVHLQPHSYVSSEVAAPPMAAYDQAA